MTSMPDTTTTREIEATLSKIEAAAAAGKLSAGAVENLRVWLTDASYAEYVRQVTEHVAERRWQELDDAFWTIIPFGTGGRRGRMYPIGSGAINDRTMGESAQGLAEYVKSQQPADKLSCAIGYDTRRRSRHFAELCAEIMVAAGFQVFFLDGYRSTPALSVAVRVKHCACGIMITASHNPPSDNAMKAYWSTGGQLLPPHDQGVIDRVLQVQTIQRVPFADALADGRIEYCQDEVDRRYLEGIRAQSRSGPRDLRIVFSPLHGVGASSVCPALAAEGFDDVRVFPPHAEPNGDFPNVPGHVSNPENPAVFDAIIEYAREANADLVMATDPDADRLGCAAPATAGGPWRTFTGNQIAALLTDFLLESMQQAGQLTAEHYVVKTLVTTELIRRIGDSYGVATHGNLLVGFKWIAGLVDDLGPEKFVCGSEESHGFMAGTYTRDKDAAVAALLLAELAAGLKAAGKTLYTKLQSLWWQHGLHAEKTISLTMPGATGMQRMQALMRSLRENPPQSLAGIRVTQVRDYERQVILTPGPGQSKLDGPQGDMVILDLSETGNYVAIRPSGTESKVKLYMFTFEPPEQIANLEDAERTLSDRLKKIEADLREFAEGV